MTDLTDQGAAFRFAKTVTRPVRGVPKTEDMLAAARYILATMEAPEPTLADEIRAWADKHYTGVVGTGKHELLALAARSEQMENDLAELHAEVERLTAANENLRKTDNYQQFRERFLTVQKGAESNAETLDPADVKPGEAWVVECRGKRRTAVKDRDAAIPWNTVNTSGVFRAENDDDITLLTRLVPARRTITNEDELHRVKRNTVIRDGVGVVCERAALGDGWFTTGNGVDQTPYIKLPATILWEPGHEHEVARLGGHQPRCPPHLQKAPE